MKHTAASFAMSPCVFVFAVALGFLAPPATRADESTPTEPRLATETAGLVHQAGPVRLRASGKSWGDATRLKAGAEIRRLRNSPLFVSLDGRFDHETRPSYNLTHWDGRFGLGWALTETTDVAATYRLDRYQVSDTGPLVDPAFQRAAGHHEVAAAGLVFRHDSRDNRLYPTRGVRFTQTGELALEALGGDYDFSRLESDVAYYATPFRERAAGTWLADLTFVEHAQLGWVRKLGGTDEVPFFERYFTSGASTVRGSRSRWYSPRGIDQEFVGGELQIVNNVEARLPIFARWFDRRLSAATFFDLGRSWHHWSEIGDFGYGVGAGLRYRVRLGPLSGVARADYGVNLDREGDNTASHVHLTFGLPF